MLTRTVAAAIVSLCAAIASGAAGASLGAAIVVKDQTALRAAPRDSAQQQAVLWQGEAVEVRAERMDYLQVYDYRRERGGFVRASHVRRIVATADETPELLSILRFLRDTSGSEALGIGFAMAYIQAAPAELLQSEAGVDALDALGTFADRLAHRASSGAGQPKALEAKLSAHLDVATRYGIRFSSLERAGRMQICYDGDAFRRVLAMRSSPEQRARAALALTRHECVDPDLGPAERNRRDEWRADVLDRVDASALSPYLMNRVSMRRASVWSSIAYQRARKGEAADGAARRALAEFAAVRKSELTDEDLSEYSNTAIRVGASRWASAPASSAPTARTAYLSSEPGHAGETCVTLMDARGAARAPLARRCTYGIVWLGSATLNREGNALAVAVQPADAWLELWVFRREANGWTIRVLPPTATIPGTGYVEFAGWVPGGAEMLLVREARGDGKYTRNFEVMRLGTLTVARQASDPGMLGPFQRWQDPAWKAATLSIR
jgi:hypothetical protein